VVDRCDVEVQDDSGDVTCRLVANIFCANGMATHLHLDSYLDHPGIVKTYKLTYEAVDIMHALFDKQSAVNQWSINSSFLREHLDFFSPKVEQLDICYERDRITFLSYTNKVVTAKKGTQPRDYYKI
jgi:cell cycle checkpoint control protein RAD9A